VTLPFPFRLIEFDLGLYTFFFFFDNHLYRFYLMSPIGYSPGSFFSLQLGFEAGILPGPFPPHVHLSHDPSMPEIDGGNTKYKIIYN
jgi:hypothetical protein